MVKITKIVAKNIFSIGNHPVEMELDSHKNTIIYGKNGSGKSLISLEVPYFGLFGKAFRKIPKGKLVNSINKKDLLVKVYLTHGADSYVIERGMLPNIFKIYKNGKLVPEKPVKEYQSYLENEILGCDEKTFAQTQLLGSANHIPFMALDTSKRREFIERLLDLEIIGYMNDVAKKDLKKIKNEATELSHEIDKHNISLESYNSFIASQEELKKTHELRIEKDIHDIDSSISDIETNIDKYTKSLDKNKIELCHEKLKEYEDKKSSLSKLVYEYTSKLKHSKEELSFYQKTDVCPTCNRELDLNKKNEVIEVAKHDIDVYTKKLDKLNSKIDTVKENTNKINSYLSKVSKIQESITKCEWELESKRTERTKIESSINFEYDKVIKEYKDKVDNETEQLSKLMEDHDAKLYEKNLYENAVKMLKDDGIKSLIIKKYIPLINKLINNYLEKLNLFVKFSLDENFNESVKSRYLDDYSYYSFSEGQKRRIDMAILFAFMEIAKKRTGIDINLVVFDEILERVDEEGSRLFLKILREFKDNNFIIVSHNDGVIDSFNGRDDRIIEVSTVNNFTKLNFI